MRELIKQVGAVVLNWEELSDIEKWMLQNASLARIMAQAPYSRYKVGAFVSCRNDSDIQRNFFGCNVERCSYTQTTHAEQNAIDSAVAAGFKRVVAVAIVAAPADKKIEWPPKATGIGVMEIKDAGVPCGHCLQIIWENCYGDSFMPLLALAPNGEIVRTTIGDALPMRFGPEDIGMNI